MTFENAPYLRLDADSANPVPADGFVLSWLYWLRAWLGLCFDGEGFEQETKDVLELAGYVTLQTHMPLPVNNRAHRQWSQHYHRRGSTLADEYHILLRLLPRDLSLKQKREQLCTHSHLGRVRIYGLANTACILRCDDISFCYDNSGWRVPILCVRAKPARPP